MQTRAALRMILPDPQLRSPSDATPRCPRAFSLVELLVVIGIIVLLATILMPALRHARESALRVKCAAQLQQIGQALLHYANDNKGCLPAFSGWHTWPAGLPDDSQGPAWTIELMPYLADPDSPLYHCPSFPVPCRNYLLSSLWASLNDQHAVRLSAITLTSRFILSGDVTALSVYPRPYGTGNYTSMDSDLSDEATDLLAFPEDGGFLMHRGGNNVLFEDLHVDAFPRFDPDAMSFHPKCPLSWPALKAAGPDAK